MAMVGVVSSSLYRRTHSLTRLAWSWVGGRLAPFYIHQMNRVNSRNGSAWWQHHKHCRAYYYYYYYWWQIKFTINRRSLQSCTAAARGCVIQLPCSKCACVFEWRSLPRYQLAAVRDITSDSDGTTLAVTRHVVHPVCGAAAATATAEAASSLRSFL